MKKQINFTLFLISLFIKSLFPIKIPMYELVFYQITILFQGVFGDSRMTPEENTEFKKEIELLKEPDPKAVNKNGIIDFDLFMEKMLSKFRFLVNKAKTYVINAFAASDLDGNGMCTRIIILLVQTD